MFRDIFAAFGQQFPNWRIRAVMTALIVLMAAIPVFELLVLQIFSTLLVEGPKELAGQGGVVIGLLAVFFIGFAITRGLHHMTKFWRVRVFRAAFAEQQAQTGVGVVGWQWAVAFDVSTYIADLVQVFALAVLLIYLDRVIGAVSAVLLVIVLIQLALLYRRQLRVQRDLMDSTVRDVEAPIRERVFSAEFSGVATSIATGVALALVVWRTFTGALLLASAIVLAMALRIFFSRVSSLAPTLMRFARDSLRLERDKGRLTARMAQGGILPTFDDDDEGDPGPDDADAPPAKPVNEKRRAALISRVLLEAQRGDEAAYHSAASRLYEEGPLGESERNALQGASAFLSYATPGPQVGPDPGPIQVFWWPKPMPGSFDEWLDPYLIHASTRRAVQFASLLKPGEVPPHLVLGGSLLSHVHANSIVVGTGVSKLEATVNPDADFVSLRGPLSARVVRRNGGPAIESFGDPRLLARRVHPIGRDATNGRLAFVRNHSDAGIPFALPEGMDELPIAGSRPEQVAAAITTLAGYDGVVTSSLGVAVVCQSYGIPCAVLALGDDPRAKRLDMEFRDHLLGAGLEADWEVTRVEPDVSAIDWSARLRVERVSSEKLDEIDAALADALRRHAAILEDELERALGEDSEEDD
jgi:hypothetical protein